ncbi:MAG: hypothetical protein A2Z34_07510 [Planctomycetes bacterium RBG_16_59_8]|nr:MAG: hypothetical protein A2Z34_07510 [Planctomycetes bacterium RBG_16_59_8]
MDSLDVVKGFINMLDGRRPTQVELDRVAPDLDVVYQRFRKAREAGFDIDLGDDVRALLIRAGKKELEKRAPFAIRRAAGLL